LNGKQYVGQTVNPKSRWSKHKSESKKQTLGYKSILYAAMKEYGVDYFTFEILEECDKDVLEIREKYWISKFGTLDPNGYNISPGGKALFGENNPFYGKFHSKETLDIISEKNKGRIANEEERKMRRQINSGDQNPFYGRRHTEEAKLKISASMTENRRADLKERMRKNNPNKDGKHCKTVAVQMIDNNKDIKIFESATDAIRYLEVNNKIHTKAKFPSNSIYDVCRGRQKTAFGYGWKYVNEGVSTNESTT
jgi:group I intron endonuclease